MYVLKNVFQIIEKWSIIIEIFIKIVYQCQLILINIYNLNYIMDKL